MKVRWREHELIFVTILVATGVFLPLLEMYTHSDAQLKTYSVPFKQNGFPFLYWKNVLLPQISIVLLVYLGYLSVNKIIIPLLKKISFTDFEKLLSLTVIKTIAAIALTGYLLALGINIITYYAKPWLFNYREYQLLAISGYNDQPLTNLFFGFSRTTGLVVLFTTLAGIRELITWFIEKKQFRILIANNITPLVFIYFLVMIYLNPIHKDFILYITCITPAFFFYLYLTFWLFPAKGEHSFLHKPILIRLLVSSFICSMPCMLGLLDKFFMFPFLFYWLLLLFIVTPLSWLLYQQRKDKIVALKGIQTALAKSDANLQLLRSQINPHFLFNTLNTLYGTALKENSEQTAKGIQKLGDMMRFMLHENTIDFISMDKEIEYLKNYIDLQKLRTQSSPGISIEDNIEEVKCNRTIAPMLLIPFIENAFKHGISLKEKSWINITLDCTDKQLQFEVKNSLHERPVNITNREKSGIGLKNVLERLKLLYPGRHEVTIQNNSTEFAIRLVITGN